MPPPAEDEQIEHPPEEVLPAVTTRCKPRVPPAEPHHERCRAIAGRRAAVAAVRGYAGAPAGWGL
jgi:hypothetical protein